MGLNIPCPYAEKKAGCGKCAPLCHAVNPVADGLGRRRCGRTRQWPDCGRYIEAWKEGVIPFDKNRVVMLEKKESTMAEGLPTQPSLEREVPCPYLVYRESGCASCAGYICAASGNRRVMETLLPTCKEEPWSCEIYKKQSG